MPWLFFYCEIMYLFAIYNLALEDSSVFWIFVVIMLLKIKSLLIARKLYSSCKLTFDPKTINNLLHRMFLWTVYKYDISTRPNILVSVLLNASLKDDDDIQRQVKLLYCAVNKLRGSGVTNRGATNCLPSRLNVKTKCLFSLFLYWYVFFRFLSCFLV